MHPTIPLQVSGALLPVRTVTKSKWQFPIVMLEGGVSKWERGSLNAPGSGQGSGQFRVLVPISPGQQPASFNLFSATAVYTQVIVNTEIKTWQWTG